MCSLTIQIRDDRILSAIRPHRLAAQDEALSRLKQGFESPWGHKIRLVRILAGLRFEQAHDQHWR